MFNRQASLILLTAFWILIPGGAQSVPPGTCLGAARTIENKQSEAASEYPPILAASAITPSGAWLIYREDPNGQGEAGYVVAKSTVSRSEWRFASSSGSPLEVSPSGQWIAYRGRAESRANIMVADLSSGCTRAVPAARDFLWIGGSRDVLVTDRPTSGANGVLEFYRPDDLSTSNSYRRLVWAALAISDDRKSLAWIEDLDPSIMYEGPYGRRRLPLIRHVSGAERLKWLTSDKLIFLGGQVAQESTLSAKPSLTEIHLIMFGQDGKIRVNSRNVSALGSPSETNICDGQEDPRPTNSDWILIEPCGPNSTHDSSRTPTDMISLEAAPSRGGGVENGPTMAIDMASERSANLTVSEADVLADARIGKYLVYRPAPDDWTNQGFDTRGLQVRDYFLVDAQTADRRNIGKLLVPFGKTNLSSADWVPPVLSPDGKFVVYYKAGSYFALDTASWTTRNISGAAGASFHYPENQAASRVVLRRSETNFPLLQGWSEQASAVLISDHFDIWMLPLQGGVPRNLTENGSKLSISYSRSLLPSLTPLADPEPRLVPFDLNVENFFVGIELNTRSTRLVSVKSGKIKVIVRDEGAVRYRNVSGRRFKYVEAATSPPAWHLCNSLWKGCRRLTSDKKSIYPSPMFITYRNSLGHLRHSIIYLPPSFEAGKKLPAVFDVYEQQAAGFNAYFNNHGNSLLLKLLRAGFAVIKPDIVPMPGDPGEAALIDVSAALDAVLQTGVVDKESVGIFGHSYGAYETNFVMTKSDRFKAAISWAGASNLLSYCNGSYAARWLTMPLCLHGQGAVGTAPWDNAEPYIRNSPITSARSIRAPILFVHGTEDAIVPIHHSIELMNVTFMRGNGNALLLRFRGQGHVFDEENQFQFEEKALSWFRHYLMHEKRPEWFPKGRGLR